MSRTLRYRARLGLGGLDEPPSLDRYVDLPDAFGRRVLVFADTEEEFDWSKPRRRDATATRTTAALPDLHRRLFGFGIRTAYMVDYPIADAPAAVAVLRDFLEAGECSIGTQLHPWVNPPFVEALTVRNSFSGNLPKAVEADKLTRLTERIEQSFGVRPTVYRAGRYGVGANSIALLEALGYVADVSVRAGFDYGGEDGPRFHLVEPRPFWVGPERRLLEIPLSTFYTGALRRFGGRLFHAASRVPRLPGLLAHGRLLGRVPLTPEGTSLAEALEAIRIGLGEGQRVFSISYHSPSVVPGHTPYVRDAADLARFNAWWDGVLTLLAKSGVEPGTVADVVAAARKTLAAPTAEPLSAQARTE